MVLIRERGDTMAKLPDPQVEGIETTWGQGYKELQDCFFSLIGQAIRKKSKEDNKNEEERKDKD